MSLQNKKHWISSLASLGLATVLVVMNALAIWSAYTTATLTRETHLASQLSDQYEIAHFSVGQEESLERKYRLEPGAEVFHQHRATALMLTAALKTIQRIGDDQDRRFVAPILLKHKLYMEATARMFDAVDAGDTKRVSSLDTDVVDPIFGFIEKQVDTEAARYHSQAIARLTRQANVQGLVKKVTPLAALLGMSLLVTLWVVQNRSKARMEAEAREILRRNEEQFRSLVRNTHDVIAVLTPEMKIRYISPAVERIWAYSVETMQGQKMMEYLHPDDFVKFKDFIARAYLHQGGNHSTEWRVCHSNGQWHYVDVIANYLPSEPGIEGILVTLRDITDRKSIESALMHQANHDTLSGLPNRSFFMDRLTWAFARARRYKEGMAVMFLDLDNFKVVNDSLGHEAGDNLLIAVSERLKKCLRPGDFIARLGGDEFTMLLEDIHDHADLLNVAEQVAQSLNEPILLAGREVFVTASIGIAQFRSSHLHAEDILRDADVAMYQAKTGGRAGYIVFDPSMNAQAMERLELEIDLRRAIDRGEFRLHYQPIMLLETNRVTELEALVRWQHPQKGLISPIKFIPIAEATGLIISLGEWVLEEACRHCVMLHNQHPHNPPIVMSVNLSTRQLQQPDLIESITRILEETGMPADSLKLEITESVMLLDAESTLVKLQKIKDMGIRLAVDDFGTGYSSMSYLSNLPVDTLKIDRSFVQKMGQQPEDDAIIRAILTMAKSMNLRVTAEGVETEAQMAQLISWGCDRVQGYYVAKPLEGDALEKMLSIEDRRELIIAPVDSVESRIDLSRDRKAA